jgi:hypothetical protein
MLLAMADPAPGTIYCERGKLLMYVRTEQRTGAAAPEHLFVMTQNRTVFQRWTSEVPPEAELVIDEEGRAQASEERWLRTAAEHEVGILVALLKCACAWLPKDRADELRKEYLETRP